MTKYNRSVSIIGVGSTPFMKTLENEDTAGVSEGELYAWAALDAMEDAGIESKDIDYYIHCEAAPQTFSNYMTPNVHVMDWIGMRGKPGVHHSEACCSGYIAVELAVDMVASGAQDIVITGGVELCTSKLEPGKPAHMRTPAGANVLMEVADMIEDRAYTRALNGGGVGIDTFIARYIRDYGLTDAKMDDVINTLTIHSRRNAALSPQAYQKKEFKDIALEMGFSDVLEFMRSDYNPKLTEYLRVNGFEATCEGAGAVIVCPTEIARNFKQQPIEVLGIGGSTLDIRSVNLEERVTEEAVNRAYEATGVKPDEIDLLLANDFIITSQLLSAEISGYLPRGEGWRYIMDGRTAYDGDKPINTNGGRTNGHAWAASGLMDHYEAVKQMRGQCGERQVAKLPETTLLRGFGGGQNARAIILRTLQ